MEKSGVTGVPGTADKAPGAVGMGAIEDEGIGGVGIAVEVDLLAVVATVVGAGAPDVFVTAAGKAEGTEAVRIGGILSAGRVFKEVEEVTGCAAACELVVG